MSAEPENEATKRAQTAAWTCGGGFFHRFHGVDHACMPIDQWRQFMDVCAETAGAAVAAARAEELERCARVCGAMYEALREATPLDGSRAAVAQELERRIRGLKPEGE